MANRLKQVRNSRYMTLEELAKKVGSSKAYMWQLENKDDPDPGVKMGMKLEDALYTDIRYLFR